MKQDLGERPTQGRGAMGAGMPHSAKAREERAEIPEEVERSRRQRRGMKRGPKEREGKGAEGCEFAKESFLHSDGHHVLPHRLFKSFLHGAIRSKAWYAAESSSLSQ